MSEKGGKARVERGRCEAAERTGVRLSCAINVSHRAGVLAEAQEDCRLRADEVSGRVVKLTEELIATSCACSESGRECWRGRGMGGRQR